VMLVDLEQTGLVQVVGERTGLTQFGMKQTGLLWLRTDRPCKNLSC